MSWWQGQGQSGKKSVGKGVSSPPGWLSPGEFTFELQT